VLGCV